MPYKETDLSYIAGIMDSDGYIGIVKQSEIRRKKNVTRCFRPVVTVTQAQSQAIAFLKETFGGHCGISKQSKNSHGWRELYRWNICNRKDVKAFLEAILPYLRIKKEQAEMVIEYCNIREKALQDKSISRNEKGQFSKSSKNTYSGIEEIMWKDIKKLNQTGVVINESI